MSRPDNVRRRVCRHCRRAPAEVRRRHGDGELADLADFIGTLQPPRSASRPEGDE